MELLWGAMGSLWGARGALGGAVGALGGAMWSLWGARGRYGALWAPCGAPSFMVLHPAAMVLGCFPLAMVSLRGALGGDRG